GAGAPGLHAVTTPNEASEASDSSASERCLRFRIMILPRTFVISVIGALAWMCSAGCRPATTAESASAKAGASAASAPAAGAPAAGEQRSQASTETDGEREMGPLTLLADEPVPKAGPSQPVSKQGWLGVALGA